MAAPGNKNLLVQYAGIGAQLLISIGIGVFIGLKADKWLSLGIPLFTCLLPLIIITAIIFKAIRDTNKK
ncbi:MAG: AtpZ/AtpI family protein [Chitinophagaceae bacterium]|nr:AtpZ/AtpI family protein [Chitinophagaceae bacterium]